MRPSEIHPAIRILRKEIRQWQEPILGVVAKESRDPFRVLIACVLSLRTKDKTTADASRLRWHYPDQVLGYYLSHPRLSD